MDASNQVPLNTIPFDRSVEEPLRLAAEAAGELNHIMADLRPLAIRMEWLNLDPINAQEHDPRNLKVIAGSLVQYGQRSTLTVNRKDPDGILPPNRIMKGNGTYISAKLLEWKWIAAGFTDDEALDAMGYGMVDNRSSELSKKNYGQTSKNMRTLKQAGHPTLELMYTDEEALPLLREDFIASPQSDEKFDASMLRGRAVTKVTASERLIIDQAIELCRAQNSKALTEGSALEKICKEYLEITAVTAAVNSDIGQNGTFGAEEDVLPLV